LIEKRQCLDDGTRGKKTKMVSDEAKSGYLKDKTLSAHHRRIQERCTDEVDYSHLQNLAVVRLDSISFLLLLFLPCDYSHSNSLWGERVSTSSSVECEASL